MNAKTKILKIEKFNKFGFCNVCGENNLNENNEIREMHKLSFGRNNYATKIYLCTKCLNNFAEILQKHLEEE